MNVGDVFTTNSSAMEKAANGSVAIINGEVGQVLSWYTGQGFQHYVLILVFSEYLGEKIADLRIFKYDNKAETLTLIHEDEAASHVKLGEITGTWEENNNHA